MAERFYTPDAISLGEFVLAGAEAHHLTTVRRFTSGDRVALFNGDGNEYEAEILGHSKRDVTLRIVAANSLNRELPFPLVIASALPKGDRTDYLIDFG